MSGLLTFIAGWTLISFGAGLIIGPVMRWGLHYELPPGDLHPMPSGSLERIMPDFGDRK